MGSSGCGAYSVRKAQNPANITAAVRVDEEVCAAVGGKGRSGGRLVAIFHYLATSKGAGLGFGPGRTDDRFLSSVKASRFREA
jgi:hypothetical protein